MSRAEHPYDISESLNSVAEKEITWVIYVHQTLQLILPSWKRLRKNAYNSSVIPPLIKTEEWEVKEGEKQNGEPYP